MENKLIRSYKLNKWNIITISIYALISFGVWIYFIENQVSHKMGLFVYTFGTQMFIYLSQYRALRNFNYFLIWVVIAVIHFCIYLNIREYPELAFVQGHASWGFRNTIISLLLFQVLRFLSLKIQNKELVVPSKSSRSDLLDTRRVTAVDIISFIVFMILTILLFVFI